MLSLTREDQQQKGISVIIPTYNSEKNISECTKSILRQTYKNYEIVIVDDHSEDNTASAIQEYVKRHPEKIVFRQNNANRGAAYSRNRAVTLAKYNCIAAIDSDATAPREWLETAMKCFDDSDVFGGCYIAAPQNIIEEAIYALEKFPQEKRFFKKNEEPQIAGTSTFFKKDVFKKVGGYDLQVRAGEDRLFLRKALFKGFKVAFYPELSVFHSTKSSLFAYFKQEDTFRRWGRIAQEIYPRKKLQSLPYLIWVAIFSITLGLFFLPPEIICFALLSIIFLTFCVRLFGLMIGKKVDIRAATVATVLIFINNLITIKVNVLRQKPKDYWK